MASPPQPPIAGIADFLADPVRSADFPQTILRFRNDRAAVSVGLDMLSDEEWIAHFGRFTPLPANLSEPLALRYHGHQFRVYNPDIGDGRGFTFAQLEDDQGRWLDLGTKGSGQTPYSRFGDGRLTLKGGVREILATEMLEALGVDTSKTFSLIETGEPLQRNDEPSPTRSAVLVRLSHGHIRIGSFQRLAMLGQTEELNRLAAYVFEHLYGETPGDQPAIRLLEQVVRRTARLAASYMAAGFVHGVLNSDNINVTGESFDYGPWRFTPFWDPEFTAAYFDHQGLYAFGRQPQAIHWDVVQLAIALAKVADIEALAPILDTFPEVYEAAYVQAMLARLGVRPRGDRDDLALVQAIERGLLTRTVGIDRFFFDWSGGKRRPGPYDRAYAEHFEEAEALLARYDGARMTDHPYWSDAEPCSMHIDEVEAIWTAIDQNDDWTPLHAKVAAIRRMGEAYPMAELISYEPATGALLWKGQTGDVEAEVAAAREGWIQWAAKPFEYRAETLRRFANNVRAHAEAFADLIARETGKPLWEAKGEVDSVVAKVDISVTAYAERTPRRRMEGAMGARTAIRHKPHGVLAVLGPYNFPAHLPNGHIVPALLAGNGVIFKPSEKTPATGAFLIERFHEAGVPEGALRLVQGGAEEGKALAAHLDIDGLLFTGSARAGASLSRQFADTPQRILALELGGNNPIVVWEPSDLQAAATIVVQSAYLSAGQRCTCARRLIVENGKEGPLLEEIAKILDRIIIGAPHDKPAPFMGPVIDNGSAVGVLDAFLDLIMKGGRAVRHMARPDNERPFLTPGLIDVTDVANRPDEEIFGPVLQMIRVADFDAAITEANATRYGLAASVITGKPQLYDRFWANTRAGVINWNRPTNGAPSNAPFGGVGISGNHRPSAFYAADYCAYPVTSVEADQPRATIGQGLLEQ